MPQTPFDDLAFFDSISFPTLMFPAPTMGENKHMDVGKDLTIA
jgi:hypothetical protein